MENGEHLHFAVSSHQVVQCDLSSTYFEREMENCEIVSVEQSIESADDARPKLLICRIWAFARRLNKILHRNPETQVIVPLSGQKHVSISEAALIVGGYLILSNRLQLQDVIGRFECFQDNPIEGSGLDPYISQQHVTVHDCWKALHHVRTLGWIDWSDLADEEGSDLPFLVDEFLHYASPANGNVHIIAPGYLMLFASPVDLLAGQHWTSLPSQGRGAQVRRFSGAFYADLFSDLGVASVACLTECRASTAAFAACGIAALDLRPGHSHGQSVLRALDGLLSLTRAGPVAVHGGGESGGWPGDAAGVVAALLVGRLGFAERSAYAWLLMLCPWLLAARA